MKSSTTVVVLTGAGGPERLEVDVVPTPVPGPGMLLVETEAAGVAFNDVTTRQGRNPGALPRVLGFDVVGRVVAVGPGVESGRVGERIAALVGVGGYATHVLARADRSVEVPAGLDAAVVDALVLNYLTAWQMLHRVAGVTAGQRVLVLGAAGGVGSALAELAGLMGAHVIGTASATRRAAVERSGATWVSSTGDVDGHVDAAFDSVGGSSLARTRRVVRAGGTVVSFGFSHAVDGGRSKLGGLALTVAALVRARLTPGPRVRLYQVESAVEKDPVGYRADLAQLIAMVADGRIHPVVTTMALSQAAEAHRRLEDRKVTGKLVLVPDATLASQATDETAGP